ncbi:Glucuronoxylan 4-O-methyltransferase 1 [Vitis vinifera]|uniref:Glucuronoxylan 4-O-methyltransferase 1 n=1 Tax=Vitis vinifera TaxID=29760 RepID=A0A438FY59_VITVI|nr:Glucuronoxylan 4-O-methyltransferase 1 [Vitis vinifera]
MDLIMVDAPTGYHDEAPGRMSAIYTAGLMARNRKMWTDVFCMMWIGWWRTSFPRHFVRATLGNKKAGLGFTIPAIGLDRKILLPIEK